MATQSRSSSLACRVAPRCSYAEGVISRSPRSRSAPWVRSQDHGLPRRGYIDPRFHHSGQLNSLYAVANGMRAALRFNPVGVSETSDPSSQGALARPWAARYNRFAVGGLKGTRALP